LLQNRQNAAWFRQKLVLKKKKDEEEPTTSIKL
jgi:hypothetical protein